MAFGKVFQNISVNDGYGADKYQLIQIETMYFPTS